MTRERQHDSRTRRDSLTDVIHAEPETFWGAYRKKLGEQPALFDPQLGRWRTWGAVTHRPRYV